jgi:endonuclease YncB( thermonuclease family)
MWSTLRKLGQRLVNLWKSGKKGKVGIGCGALLILFLTCGVCGSLVGPTEESSEKPFPTEESFTSTPISQSLTDASTSTKAPDPTATTASTETPPPATPTAQETPTTEATPTPTRTEAQVVEVVDGDTIKVDIGGEVHTVRYIGIDTPETKHPEKPVEWMGPEASATNRELVGGKTVYLEKDVSETDQYGRLLRYVFLADGTFVNAELVGQGYAQAISYPPDVKYQDTLTSMQREAREAANGLWGSTPTSVPPSATPVPPTPTLLPPTPVPSTATPVPPTAVPPTPTPVPPTEPPAAPGDVQITYIYYDGQVKQVESDEYVVIKNVGGSSVNLGGWRLNADDAGQDFVFPNFELQPGQECRVYTNEDHPEWCGFSFHSGSALWANSGECGHLYDPSGAEVSTHCY